jgi:hypothetical protein
VSIGECVLTTTDEGVRIDQADPEILIASELLDEMRAGSLHPDVSLDGELLRIEGINRTVIYRLGDKVPDLHACYASWPD